MRIHRWLAIPAVLGALTACGNRQAPPPDDALSRDLSLAASVQPAQPQIVSPAELGYGQMPQPGYGQPYATQPYPYGAYPQPYPQQTRVVYAPAPAPRVIYRGSASPEPVRHTKRDAIIGAAAGTIAGAAIGHDVKGALVGAAAGGLLGAVVGHTVDVSH